MVSHANIVGSQVTRTLQQSQLFPDAVESKFGNKLLTEGNSSEPVCPRAENHLVTLKPAVRARGGDFFRYTDAGKILPT